MSYKAIVRVISDTHLAYTTAMIGNFESFANISKNKKKVVI